MISMVTRAIFGFGPQYLSLRSSTMREFNSYSASLYGPVPMGFFKKLSRPPVSIYFFGTM